MALHAWHLDFSQKNLPAVMAARRLLDNRLQDLVKLHCFPHFGGGYGLACMGNSSFAANALPDNDIGALADAWARRHLGQPQTAPPLRLLCHAKHLLLRTGSFWANAMLLSCPLRRKEQGTLLAQAQRVKRVQACAKTFASPVIHNRLNVKKK